FYDFGTGFFVYFPKTGQYTLASGISKSVRQRYHSFTSLIGGLSSFTSGSNGAIGGKLYIVNFIGVERGLVIIFFAIGLFCKGKGAQLGASVIAFCVGA